MDQKSILEFSPIIVRKNYLVTGARLKPICKQSSSGFFNTTKKNYENFSAMKFSYENQKDLGLNTLLKKPNFRAKSRELKLFDANFFELDSKKY